VQVAQKQEGLRFGCYVFSQAVAIHLMSRWFSRLPPLFDSLRGRSPLPSFTLQEHEMFCAWPRDASFFPFFHRAAGLPKWHLLFPPPLSSKLRCAQPTAFLSSFPLPPRFGVSILTPQPSGLHVSHSLPCLRAAGSFRVLFTISAFFPPAVQREMKRPFACSYTMRPSHRRRPPTENSLAPLSLSEFCRLNWRLSPLKPNPTPIAHRFPPIFDNNFTFVLFPLLSPE